MHVIFKIRFNITLKNFEYIYNNCLSHFKQKMAYSFKLHLNITFIQPSLLLSIKYMKKVQNFHSFYRRSGLEIGKKIAGANKFVFEL